MAQVQHSSAGRRDGRLWAVTCYFNPTDSRRRLANYRTFRRRLTVPLVTVEQSLLGAPHLTGEDADILVTLNSPDILWQKERLLNVALERLPGHCDTVAWLDSDIVFGEADWPRLADQQLRDQVLVQLFSLRLNTLPGCSAEELESGPFEGQEESIVSRLSRGTAGTVPALPPGMRGKCPVVFGAAWCCRRNVLQEHGLYDACILGGGDRAVLGAALGEYDDAADRLLLSERHREHYMEWARPFFETVQGRVGWVDQKLYHLWHGKKKNRLYRKRHETLNAYELDPRKDIALDSSGCWRWNSDKKDLHEEVKRYFDFRNEDGKTLSPDAAS